MPDQPAETGRAARTSVSTSKDPAHLGDHVGKGVWEVRTQSRQFPTQGHDAGVPNR